MAGVERRVSLVLLNEPEFRRGVDAGTDSLDRNADAVERSDRTIGKANGSLRDSQGRFKKAGDAAEEMGDKVDGAGQKASRVGGALESIGGKAKLWIAGIAASAVLALGLALFRAFRGAVDLENQMVEVAKTAGLSSRGILKLRDDLLDVSRSTGIATDKLTGYAETAGQLGIRGSRNILAFVEAAAKLEAVSDLDADRAASALAKISNAFKIPIEQADQLGSVMNELSNTTPATAGDIADGLTRIGGAGEAIGITVDQAAGLQATLVGAGIESERAGTALRNLFIRVQTEAEATAQVMGTTTAEWSKRLETDGMGAVMDLLEVLGEMPQAARAATIEDIFGAESFLQVSTLAQGLDTLRANLGTAGEAFAQGTSLDKEFAVSLQSVSAQKDLLLNKLSTFAAGVGSKMLPAVGSAIGALNRWTESTDELTRRHSALAERVGNTDEVERLLGRYRALEGEGLTPANDATGEMRRLIDEINSRMPGFVSGYDSAGRAVGIYADKLSVALTRQQALNRAMEAAAFQKTVERFADASDERRRAQRRRDQAPDDLYRAPVPFRAGRIGAAIGDRMPWSQRNTRRRSFEEAGEAIPRTTAEMEDLAVAVGQYTDLTRTAAEVQRDLATRGMSLTAEQARELTQTYRDLGLAQAETKEPPPPPPDNGAPLALPSAASSATPPSAPALADTLADEEAVVTARRNMAEASAQHAIEMEREALEASRSGAEARLALIADEGQRATARYVADQEYARAREALAEREVASRLEAARAAADGEQAAAEARARQTYARSEKTAADSKELRASTEAAQAVGDQKRLEADEAAALARARIHTGAVEAEAAREAALSEFYGEQAARRAEMIRQITEAPAPDVGATLSGRVADELAADIERARLRMERGIIDPEAFRQEVSALREHARGEIEKIADDMAKLGPIGAVAAAAILAAFDQTKGVGFDQALDDLAEMTRLADEISAAFAALGSDVLADLSSSIGDVTSALARAREVSQKKKDKVQGFTGLAGSLASLGSAAGVITAAVGAMGALKGAIFGAAEENRRNAEALADARRATEANTRALLSGQVGSDVSRDQLDAFEGGRDAVREAVEGIFDGRFFDTGLSEANEALGAFLRSLEDAGLDVSEFQSRFDAARDLTAGARRDAFASILDDMERRFGQIGASLGDYSADFAGAVAQLEDDLRQLGLSGADALDAFVAKLREADLGPVVDGFLDTMAALEPGTDEYEAALRAFYKSVREGGVSLPSSMSMDDLEALLDSFRGIRGEGGASASDVDRTNATSTAQATFAQQDATNGYLQGLWRTVREWFAAWKGEGPSGVAGAPLAGSLPLPTAPPLAAPSVPDFAAAIDAQRAQNHADLRAIYGVLAAVSAPAPGASRDDLARLRQPDGARVTVGPVTVSGVGDAEAIARQAGDEVYRRIVRELRAPQVVRGRTQ